MPLIQVNYASAANAEKKEELISELTKTYARVMCANESSVWVMLNEVERENWGVGGKSLSTHDAEKRA